MASISTQRNGSCRIKFYDEKKQQTVYLGRVDLRTARSLCEMVEEVLAARRAGQPLHATIADRVGRLSPAFRAKFERVGVLEPLVPKEAAQESLGAFLAAYLDYRSDVKVSTRDNLLQAQKALVEYFGAGALLDSVTSGDADEFRNWLQKKRKRPLAVNTARRLCGRAKQFFAHAVRKRLLAENPFGHMRGLIVRGNSQRQRFIDPEVIDRVLAGCPDADWRLLIVLCRYGGLRPSEACNLRWEHIDWDRKHIRVRCEKTAHHVGREWREVPFFPQIVPYLQDSWDAAPEGAMTVLRNLRATRNLRKPFQDLLRRVGITPWPKPFQNLRSTRETELARAHPEHVVCAWLGNTGRVAREHYLQVTADDHRRAVAGHTGDWVDGQRGVTIGVGSEGPNAGNPKCNPAPVGIECVGRNGVPTSQATNAAKCGPDAPFRSGASGATSSAEDANSPSRIRTYNLPVNSRPLYR